MRTPHPIGVVVVVARVQRVQQEKRAETVALDCNLVLLDQQYSMQAVVVVVHTTVLPAQADRVVAVMDQMETMEHQEQSTPVAVEVAQDIRVQLQALAAQVSL